MTPDIISNSSKSLIKLIDEPKLLVLKSILNCNNKNNFCGIELCDELGMSKNLLSYHINSLKKAGILDEEKIGRKKYYFVQKEKKLQVKKILVALEII